MSAPTRPPKSWFVQYGLEEFIPLVDDLLIRINSGRVWAEQCRRLTRGLNPLIELALQRDISETLAEYERLYKSIGECLEWLQRDAQAVLDGAQPAAGAMQQVVDTLNRHGLPHPESLIVEIEREYQSQRQRSQGRRGPQSVMRGHRRVVSSRPDNIPIGQRQLVVELRGIGGNSRPTDSAPGFHAEDLSPERLQARIPPARSTDAVAEPTEAIAPAAAGDRASSSKPPTKKPGKGDRVESRFAMLDVEWEESDD